VTHIHYNPSDSFDAIVKDASTALHMGKGERALLSFYATCSSGFRPSLKAIASATGQNRSQVWRNRNALVNHGVAAECDGSIVIDWSRLKLFGSLDPKLTSKRSWCAPLNSFDERLSIFEFKSLPFSELISRLSAMTENEYGGFCRRLKNHGLKGAARSAAP